MIGRTVGHYRITEKLGGGGMGVVYKAEDTRLHRSVALKFLPEGAAKDPQALERFRREARAASALNHPNICTIYDIDEADGAHFISMEYVRGKTVHQLIQARDLPLRQAVEYAIQIADALSKAHAAGIVHRDLKPSNVMITEEGLVKVLDFGLAKLTRRAAAASGSGEEDKGSSLEQVTGEGVVLGTLSYMSPEQARGEEIDYRSDIFSIGIVLYQMITGELPFQGPHAASVLEKLLNHPTPSLKRVNPYIPDVLDRTIARATAKNPEDRFQSMRELAASLQSLNGTKDLNATTASFIAPRVKKAVHAGRRWAILVFAVLTLVLLFALPYRELLRPILTRTVLPERIRLVVLPFMNVGNDSGSQPFCDGLMQLFTTKFNLVEQFQSTLSVVPASDVLARKVTSAEQARRAFGANLVFAGSVQKYGDGFRLTMNLVDAGSIRQIDSRIYTQSLEGMMAFEDEAFESAATMLELKLDSEARKALGAGKTAVAGAYNSYLEAIGYLGRYDVPENLEKSIQLFRMAIREDSRYALAHAGLGEAYWRKFKNTRERKWAEEALSSCERARQLENRLPRVHLTLGLVYTGIGQPGKGADELKRAIALEPRSADAHRELGRAYELMGRTDEAEANFLKAIRLEPDSWSCRHDLGSFYYHRARYDEAAAQFLEVIRLAPDHFSTYSSLGGIYLFQGKFDRAEEMFRKSLDIRPSMGAYSNLAASCILRGRAAEAVPLLEKAIEVGNAGYEVWGNLGDAYSQTPGLSAKAPAAYRRAADLASEYLAVKPMDAAARAQLAFYLVQMGDRKRALQEIDKAGRMPVNDENVPFWAALVFEAAGDRERALQSLASAIDAGYSPALIRVVSDLRDLRKDPRYRDLMEGRRLR